MQGRYSTKMIRCLRLTYAKRVAGNMSHDDIEAMQNAMPAFAMKIKQKIETLQAVYQLKQFDGMLGRPPFLPFGKSIADQSLFILLLPIYALPFFE